jgi:hypothetical protein
VSKVSDHAVEAGHLFRNLAGIVPIVFLGALERLVGDIGRDVGEERRRLAALGVQPLDGLAEKQVGAVAVGLLEPAVVQQGRVLIAIARRVAAGAGVGLPDSAAAVDVDFVEPAPIGLVGGLVAQVPLAENAVV